MFNFPLMEWTTISSMMLQEEKLVVADIISWNLWWNVIDYGFRQFAFLGFWIDCSAYFSLAECPCLSQVLYYYVGGVMFLLQSKLVACFKGFWSNYNCKFPLIGINWMCSFEYSIFYEILIMGIMASLFSKAHIGDVLLKWKKWLLLELELALSWRSLESSLKTKRTINSSLFRLWWWDFFLRFSSNLGPLKTISDFAGFWNEIFTWKLLLF